MKSAILPSKREHVAVMRKATKVLLFISLSFLFTFTSCQNIFEDSVSDSESHTVQTDENNNQLPEQKQNGPAAPAAPVVIPKVSFKGSLNVNGALPEKMEKVLADPSIYDEEALEDENSSVFARLSRAARPKLPAVGSAYEYFVKATDQTGLSKEAVPHLDPDDNKYKYKLELEINKTWTFQAGFRKKAVGEEGDADYEPEKILLIDTETEVENSYSETLNEATVETTHNFVLKPMKTPDGKGKLQLLMETIPPEVTQLKLFVPDEVDGHAVPWLSNDILEVALHSSTSITSPTGVSVNNYIRSKDDAFNIPSGAYDVTLIFYKTVTGVTEPVPCYITCQTINIFDNMVTDSWINESGASADGAINSTTGVFALSNDLMQNFLETTIYVGQLAGGTVSASDGNTGSAYSPLATLGRAFELIQVQGNGSPYRIYITGSQTGNFTIPSGIGTTQASSIEISGIGNTPSVLDGNKAGTVLKVDSAVPVTLKNIRITNGKAESGSPTSGKGGGIYIASGASVTLGTDAIIGGIPAGVTSAAISENSSSNYALSGGGVYCEGSLILKRGSEVSYNYASDSSFENGGGGGIRCKNGTLKIEDGSKISMNGSANAGAGIALEATDFIMTGGLVSDNRNNNSGGGIYNSACTRFVISGGVISGNHANTGGGLSISNGTTTESVISGNTLIEKNSSGSLGRGGGIYVSSGILNLQGVTIKNNTSVSTYPGGAVAVSGTATFKISGSTYIPYGVATSTETGVSTETGPGKNDIYLDSGKTITLESDLSRHTASDRLFVTLPAANWVRSTSVVSAATGFTITDTIKDKIGYTTAGWISKIESNTIKLDSPIYVKASGNASATGTSADPFDNIQHALSAMIDSNKDYVIYVDGTINGPQEIPAESMTPAFAAKSITIEGVNNGTLDGQSCNSSVLDIEATCDVTIRNLTIKGADNINTGSPSPALGGGINANTTGKLTLATGTIITENKCGRIGDGIGGGVYKSAGILEIKDGVEISRNTATSGGGIASMSSATIIMSGGTIKGNSVSSYGGGLFLNGGKLFMYGSAVIGTASESLTEYTVDQGCNLADTRGGGICALSGNVYIGFTGLDSSNNPVLATGEDALTGGIMGNYAGTEGAGIYSEIDRFIVGDGNISRNKTGENGKGGAIYNSSSCTIRGGNISDNIATYGGAIYNGETLKLEGGAKIPGSATAGANDIYLAVNTAPLTQYVVTVCASEFSHHSEATPIYLTLPAWERGTKILEAADTTVNIDSAKNYFNLTEGGWAKSIYDTDSDGTYDTVKITSPLYVAGSNNRVACSAPPASGACGTIAKPYATIAAALAASDLAEAGYTITIDGTVTGAQTISSPAANITLTGYKASGATSSTAKIDAGGATGAGSALTVDASGKTVTITDLTITGGTGSDLSGGTAKNGGGIYLNAGIVKLANGAVVTGNQADVGGGVYLNSGSLFLYGSAVVGKSGVNSHATDSSGGYGNKATVNGGGIAVNTGNLYIGYSSAGIPADTSGGVIYNLAKGSGETHGGGIDNTAGIVNIARGNVSYNYACSSNSTNNGCGGGISTAKTVNLSGTALIEGNSADNGGAFNLTYNYSDVGILTMSGGSIVNNTAAALGGAIYQNGTFNVSGSASIPYGGAVKKNDVYLSPGKTITINSTTLTGGDTVATITPNSFIRGRRILSLGVTVTESQLNTLKAKFALTETGWDKENIQESGGWTGVEINSPIYVAGASGREICSAPSDSGANGTKVKPYATIAAALGASDLSTAGGKITIDGTLSAQTIASTTTVSGGLSAVTLQGYKTSSATTSSATISGGGTASALTIGLAKEFTIKDLQITNGKASAGGGINISSGTGTIVNLETNAKVYSNKASSGGTGAGVYVESGATLNIKNGSEIYSNTAASGTINGAGVYNAGTVVMSGGSIYSNTANLGGAIYNAGSLTMSGGTIGGSSMQNSVSGTSAAGGAIYQNGTFNISGSAVVYAGSEKTNDVYLAGTTKYVTVAGTINLPSGYTAAATITPYQWRRRTKFLSASSTNATILANSKSKFVLSRDDSGWEKNDDTTTSTDTTRYVWISSPIYVAGSSGRTVCNAPPSTGRNGTKSSPYATIAEALADSDLSYTGHIIAIDGTLSAQTIASTTTVSSDPTGTNGITLQGYKESGTSSATIDGGGTTSALTIALAKTFTIKDIDITNGSASAGGGINITAAATVNLDNGAKVYSNKATSDGKGAGVNVVTGATLNIKSGALIYSNSAASGNINGAGVYNAGTVDMTGGQIYNNTANNGGGIYNTGTLYVRETALIGDTTSNSNTATGDTAGSTCSNSAANCGGGIYNSGNLYFGCNSSGSSSATGYALSTGYGVRRNHAKSGGAIYLGGGTFKAASGTVSYNHATSGGAIYVYSGTEHVLGAVSLASNKVSSAGGALYLDYSTKLTVNGTAEFIVNSAEATSGSNNPCGGAVYNYGTLEITANATMKGNFSKVSGSGTGKAYGGAIANYGTLTMSSGMIGVSGVPNSVSNTVSGYTANAYGGAIYQNGTFNVSGSTKVLPGTERSNDVFLASGKVVNVAGSIGTSGNTTTSQMAITPSTWKRGTQVLTFGSGVTASNEIGKFKGTETDWKTVVDSSVGKLYTEYKIYVSSSGTSSGTGTSSNPYTSIATAVNQCWTTGKDFTIYVSGNLSGQQTIPAANSTNKTGLAKSITLSGKNGSSSDGINRNLTTSASTTGTALVINTSYPVTLTKLKIQKGYSSTNGGGINNASAALTIGSDVVITSNQATSSGGGIYSGGNVTITGGEISSNSAADGGGIYLASSKTLTMSAGEIKLNHVTGNGGGVYLASSANICMSGTALIGKSSGVSSAASSTSACSNYAKYGGGIYSNGGKVYLGYTSTSAMASTFTGGVYYNYSTNNSGSIDEVEGGGGICCVGGTFKIYKGNVSYNGGYHGGGIFLKNGTSTTHTIIGGVIASNKASDSGGGVCISSGTVSISSGQIQSNEVEKSGAYYFGGAVYTKGILNLSGSIYIPCTGVGKNDIFTPGVTSSNTSKVVVTSKLTNTATKIATINCSNTSRVCFEYTGTDSTFAAEAAKFNGYYNTNTGYIIYSDGKLKKGYSTDDAITAIGNMTSTGTIVISGSISSDQFASIKSKLDSLASGVKVTLDFSAANITSIPAGVFGSSTGGFVPATNLKKIIFPKNCEVGDWAFYNCSGLTTVEIPEGVKLKGHTFNSCTSIDSVDLSNIASSSDLRELFSECTNMTTVTLSPTVSTATDLTRMFYQCTNLQTIWFNGTLAEWNTLKTKLKAVEGLSGVSSTCSVIYTGGSTTVGT